MAQKLGVAVLLVNARTPEEIERGFAAMKRDRADAVIVLSDAFFIGQRRQIAFASACPTSLVDVFIRSHR